MNQENYCALVVSIIVGCFPETAFKKLESAHPDSVQTVILPEDIYWMKKLKARGLTYKQIGEIYGLKMDRVYGWIKRRGAKERGKRNSIGS